jgi:hypothetical protein
MNPDGRWIVTIKDDEIACTRPDGSIEFIKWSNLQAVLIETTDQGPFVSDLFWVLIGDVSACIIPQDAEGSEELLKRLQMLPGFNNQAVIEAMGSTQNRRFTCWQRETDAIKDLIKKAPDQRLPVYIILKEDSYETAYGDGYYGYFEEAFFSEKEAKTYIEQLNNSGYRYHLKTTILWLKEESIKQEIELSPFEKADIDQVIAALLKRLK